MTAEIILLIACVIGSAYASGSETALISASPVRLRHLRDQGRPGAAIALTLLSRRDRTLVVTLVATNVCNISGGVIATDLFELWMGPIGSVLAVMSMTAVLLVLAEIVPKAYFRHHAESMLMQSGWIWRSLDWILTPLSHPLQRVQSSLLRLFRSAEPAGARTRADLKLLLQESVEYGGLRDHEKDLLASALDLPHTAVREVMVPLPDATLLPDDSSSEALRTLVRERGYTRIPIYRERVDQIIGVVNAFDVIYDPAPHDDIRPYIKPITIVPEMKPVDELLRELQRGRQRVAVVVSEYGTCVGIVSIEDILEEIVGELTDEHEAVTPEIDERGPGHYLISGRANVDDVNQRTGWRLPKPGVDTIGGYVLYRMGRIPRRGETFTDGRLRFRIAAADRFGVQEVEVREIRETRSKPASSKRP